MGLDWSTFLLEVINFLILVWILKRFLYAPVKAAIERRQRRVEAILADAESQRAEADRLRAEYESREQEWERERASARADFDQSLTVERTRRIQAIEQEIERQRQQADTLDARRQEEAERRTQERALELAATFAATLLSRIADPNLETRLLEMLSEDLESLDERQRGALAATVREDGPGVRVRSAYPLSDVHRSALESALSQAAGVPLKCDFGEDPELIAGLRIEADYLVLQANLREELRFFAEAKR
jgi:F-type H+-transporting ATPase subunit b